MDPKAPSGLARGPSTWATAVHKTNVRTGTSLEFNRNLETWPNMSKLYCSPTTSPTCSSIQRLLWHFRRLPPLVLIGVSTFRVPTSVCQMTANQLIYTQLWPMCTGRRLWLAENMWCRIPQIWLVTGVAHSLAWLMPWPILQATVTGITCGQRRCGR